MDSECIDRFAEWFASHLSNFDYKWTWSNWDYILTDEAPQAEGEGEEKPAVNNELKRRFVSDVLERLMRLSYWERIQPTVPEEFASLLPPKPVPTFKYDDALVSFRL